MVALNDIVKERDAKSAELEMNEDSIHCLQVRSSQLDASLRESLVKIQEATDHLNHMKFDMCAMDREIHNLEAVIGHHENSKKGLEDRLSAAVERGMRTNQMHGVLSKFEQDESQLRFEMDRLAEQTAALS